MKLSLSSQLASKNLLVTGFSGFLGGVLVSMLLHDFTVNKLYVLIRGTRTQSAQARFDDIINSPVFLPLHQKWPHDWKERIKSQVEVLEGNVSLPLLGLSPQKAEELQNSLDVVIHAAGCVAMVTPINKLLDANVKGAMHVCDFINGSAHARLLHISTCYVVGNQDGVFGESTLANRAPNGQSYDPQELLEEDYTAIERIKREHTQEKAAHKALIQLGLDKAAKWGWPNPYAYTKALVESLLEQKCCPERLTIFRPSILESALTYPTPGWNQGFNTSGPLIYLVGGWYPFLPSRKEVVLDIVPVDLACRAIIIVAAALSADRQHAYYHFGTSGENPLDMEMASKFARRWHRQYLKTHGKNWWERHLRAYLDLGLIAPSHALSPSNLRHMTQNIHSLVAWIVAKSPPPLGGLLLPMEKKCHKLDASLRRWASIYDIFIPYIYSHKFVFETKHIGEIFVEEEAYRLSLGAIEWETYFNEVHIPGLQTHCFTKFKKEAV